MKGRFFLAVIVTSLLTSVVFADVEKPQSFSISVTEKGFEPSHVDAKANSPVILKVTRKTDATCATQVQVPSKKIKKDLPLNQEVSISLGKLQKGEIRFGCGMGMMMGGIISAK